MRSAFLTRYAPLLTGALLLAALPAAGAQAGTAPSGGPMRARITGAALPYTSRTPSGQAPAAPAGLPPKKQQIKVLTAALNLMHKNYVKDKFAQVTPGPMDIFDYGIGALWKKGIDGAGTTVAVIEGWDFPGITKQVAQFDKALGLPNPQIKTIFPDGKLPKNCPAGMVKLGSFGSCNAWEGELALDVMSAHLVAPYAKIVISATPADSQITDDASFQVAPPEMMKALEFIAAHHVANSISISDGIGESSYSHGSVEVTSQDPGELAAAAAGIPVLVATGDCGVVQNLPVANSQCGNASREPDTAAWDDSPWTTAVGGSIPNLSNSGVKLGSDPVWHVGGIFSEGAGYSSIYARPSYQNSVAKITGSPMRSVPDITMDAQDGTSEAAPLLNGVLALATQLNHDHNLGPINPALYAMGPHGAAAGIADVIHGNDSVTSGSKTLVQGFTAAKGFDVATGWGTVNGNFESSLVAFTKANHQEAAARNQARAQLNALETRSIRLTPGTIAKGGSSYLFAPGFLPGHPVTLLIDGKKVTTLVAGALGTVTDMVVPSQLKLAPGRHTVELESLVVNETASFTTK